MQTELFLRSQSCSLLLEPPGLRYHILSGQVAALEAQAKLYESDTWYLPTLQAPAPLASSVQVSQISLTAGNRRAYVIQQLQNMIKAAAYELLSS